MVQFEIEIPQSTIEEINRRIHEALIDTQKQIVNEAKKLCPVGKTGDLMKSIHGTTKKNVITIASAIEYAAYVEYGTPRMIKAHGAHDPDSPVTKWKAKTDRGAAGTTQQMPFMRPAIHRGIHDYLWTNLKREFKT